MSFYITKASGEKELFNIKKFKRSLQKAGASEELIKEIVRKIEQLPKLRNTKKIYNFALEYLNKSNRPIATRYNLKQALMELGPAGFPFELFIAELFQAQGYKIEKEKIIQGACIAHEIDISAQKSGKHFIVECKFHNRRGLKSDVKVALYIKARFDDIKKKWEKDPNHGNKIHQAWIVTNTKFTSVAIEYSQCVGIQLLDWRYPEKKSLPDLINKLGLHPITALTSLNKREKKECIKAGFVLCRDASKHKKILQKLHLSEYKIKNLIEEAEKACSLTAKK